MTEYVTADNVKVKDGDAIYVVMDPLKYPLTEVVVFRVADDDGLGDDGSDQSIPCSGSVTLQWYVAPRKFVFFDRLAAKNFFIACCVRESGRLQALVQQLCTEVPHASK